MIKVQLSNEILRRISAIDKNRYTAKADQIPAITANKLRKNSKKKSAYSSNRIEGNPLTEEQANNAIEIHERDPHKHLLKPEQEVRNYFLALNYLDECLKNETEFSEEFILKVQSIVEKGASKEKIGLRGAMPPGVLFAVYDAESGAAEYIPPMHSEIPDLLHELVQYVNTTDDHPLIVAAVVHYQIVTIHPFEDGNGRTARLLSGYILDKNSYGFGGIGSLEEYFAYDPQEYYQSLQMGLPPLYYDGRDNPPHPEIWINYFLRMVELYSTKVSELAALSSDEDIYVALSYLSNKERGFLGLLLDQHLYEFKPIDVAKRIGVTNKTVINRCQSLCRCGLLVPILVNQRICAYKLSDLAISKSMSILDQVKN